jgi:ribosomal protein S18 acetylase RimI-like enzyme
MSKQADDLQTEASILTDAFINDPLSTFLVKDIVRRRLFLNAAFISLLRYGKNWGTVFSDEAGIGILLGPSDIQISTTRMFRCGFLSAVRHLGLRSILKYATIVSRVNKTHSSLMSVPHYYLWIIGVSCQRQGKGHGTKLAKRMLESVDDSTLPCYLETWNDRNLGFYHNIGFETATDRPLRILDDLLMWPMARVAK